MYNMSQCPLLRSYLAHPIVSALHLANKPITTLLNHVINQASSRAISLTILQNSLQMILED